MALYTQINAMPFNGLILDIDVHSYTPERPAPHASTPDCPGYDDEGDAEGCEWDVVKQQIDCEETALELFNRCLEGYPTMEEDLHNAICEKIREEQE